MVPGRRAGARWPEECSGQRHGQGRGRKASASPRERLPLHRTPRLWPQFLLCEKEAAALPGSVWEGLRAQRGRAFGLCPAGRLVSPSSPPGYGPVGEGPAQLRTSGAQGFNEPAGLSFPICAVGRSLVWPWKENKTLRPLWCYVPYALCDGGSDRSGLLSPPHDPPWGWGREGGEEMAA